MVITTVCGWGLRSVAEAVLCCTAKLPAREGVEVGMACSSELLADAVRLPLSKLKEWPSRPLWVTQVR